jgi:hypothetical protein
MKSDSGASRALYTASDEGEEHLPHLPRFSIAAALVNSAPSAADSRADKAAITKRERFAGPEAKDGLTDLGVAQSRILAVASTGL